MLVILTPGAAAPPVVTKITIPPETVRMLPIKIKKILLIEAGLWDPFCQTKTDNNNRMITMKGDFYLVIFNK